jgi:cytochrome c biogenesis protein CcmG/thiol:disulfide interchange protein DsbE
MTWRARILRLLILPLLFLPAIPFLKGCDETPEKIYAADFSLKLFDGRTFTLSKHKGEAIVVNFFASWCIPCRAEAPALEAMHQKFLEKKVLFLGIAIKDTDTAAKDFVKKYGLTFPTGLDVEQKAKDALGVYGLPTTFFIDGTGLIAYTHAGGVTEELIKHELDKIL